MHAVIITKEVRAKLEAIGIARNAAKHPSWSRRKSDVFSDAEVDILGLFGEYAAGYFLGIDVDSTIHAHGDDGIDLKLGKRTVAVKYNHRWRGYLMVEERPKDDPTSGILHDLTSDIIVLTHGKCLPPKRCFCRQQGGLVVAVSGWMPRREFIAKMEKRDLGLGGRYICKADQLRSMNELHDLRAKEQKQ